MPGVRRRDRRGVQLQARGICPSCTARRMADTAAHLVDRVLPRAPYRQWVFTVPKPLRLRARARSGVGELGRQARGAAIGAWQRRDRASARAPRAADRRGHVCPAVRWAGQPERALPRRRPRRRVRRRRGGGLAFAMHPVPTSADVLAILDRIVRRVARRLADEARRRRRRGRGARRARAGPGRSGGDVAIADGRADGARRRAAARVARPVLLDLCTRAS